MFRSSLSLLVGLLCMGCQPLPDISVTLGPESPTTSEHLVVSLEVLGQEATSDELRPSFAYAYTWYRNGESVEGQTSDYLSPDVTCVRTHGRWR